MTNPVSAWLGLILPSSAPWLFSPQRLLPLPSMTPCPGQYPASTDSVEMTQLLQGTQGSSVSSWSPHVSIYGSISPAHLSRAEKEVMLHFLGRNKRKLLIILHYF